MSNIYKGRTDNFVHKKKVFIDKEVSEYSLELKAVPIDEHAEHVDYVPLMVPVKGKSFKFQKVINENVKGASLRDIVAFVDKTGDASLLNVREPIYGDISKVPTKTVDKLQAARTIEEKFETMSPEMKALVLKFGKMTNEEKRNLLKSLSTKKVDSVVPGEEPKTDKKENEVK